MLIWFFGLVFGTIWIWLPILIIVLVMRSNKKNAQGVQQPQGNTQQYPPRPEYYQGNNEAKKEEINKKIYAELKKEKPNMRLVKTYMADIDRLSAEAPKPAGMSDYSYNGAPPNGDGNMKQVHAAPVAKLPKEDNHAGLNAILYIGSLLVVVGVGALVASVVEDSIKMMIMLIIIAIFYLGGMFMRRDKRLVSSSKALIGTALATIPFLGFGFAEFLVIPGEVAWLMTSVIGLIAYVATTIVLKSKVIAYLSMAFLISVCLSMSATLALPMMYYFMFVMLVGIVAGIVRMIAGKKVPELFSSVVNVTGKWLTLLTLAVSILFVGFADGQMYVWLFWLAAAQTALMWADAKRLTEEILFRVITHLAIIITFTQVFSDNMAMFGVLFLILAVVHASISFVLSVFLKKSGRMAAESAMIITLLVTSMISFIFVLIGGEERLASVICMVAMIFSGVMCGIMSIMHKKLGWLYGVMAVMAVLPMIIGSWVMEGSVRWNAEMYFVIYLLEMLAALFLRMIAPKKRLDCDVLGVCAVILFGGIAVLFSLSLGSMYQIMGLVLWAAAIGAYGWITKRVGLYETAVYFGAVALCRISAEVMNEVFAGTWTFVEVWTYILVYAHIFALALIGTSLWRERGEGSKIRLGFAMGILTTMVGGRALAATGADDAVFYPLWFLILELVFVVVGGLWKKKWMWVWGACGVAVAIMWFVRDMAFLWLILLGLGLIALVVWSLLRPKKK